MHRIEALDIYRFFLMALMALAHTVSFVVGVTYYEFWFSTSVVDTIDIFFFIRIISHLAAPGFFLVLGIGIALFVQKNKKKGVSLCTSRNTLLKRGLILIFIQFCIVNGIWFLHSFASQGYSIIDYYKGLFGLQSHIYYFGVLWALGAGLCISSFCICVGNRGLLIVSGLSIFISTVYIALVKSHTIGLYEIVAPVFLAYSGTHISVFYPVIPWIGVITFGMFLGRTMLHGTPFKIHQLYKIGAVMIGVGLFLRIMHIGNAPFNQYDSLATFLNVTKYSPSLVFLLLTVGCNVWIFAFLLQRHLPQTVSHPLAYLGQGALHFYILHLWALLLIVSVVPVAPTVVSVFVIWILLVIFIFPLSVVSTRLYRGY